MKIGIIGSTGFMGENISAFLKKTTLITTGQILQFREDGGGLLEFVRISFCNNLCASRYLELASSILC